MRGTHNRELKHGRSPRATAWQLSPHPPCGKWWYGRDLLREGYSSRDDCAVKVLHTDLAKDDDFLKIFQAEARTVSQLEHPNIVLVFDFGVEGNTLFLVMPYSSNGTLAQRHPRPMS